jgi:hypothetical protein
MVQILKNSVIYVQFLAELAVLPAYRAGFLIPQAGPDRSAPFRIQKSPSAPVTLEEKILHEFTEKRCPQRRNSRRP